MLVVRIPISPSPILQTLNIYKLKEKSLQSPISIYPRNISGYLKNIQSSEPSTIKKLHASIPLYCFSFESIRISAIFFVSVCRHFKLKSIILNIDYITRKIAFVRSLHTGITATIFRLTNRSVFRKKLIHWTNSTKSIYNFMANGNKIKRFSWNVHFITIAPSVTI